MELKKIVLGVSLALGVVAFAQAGPDPENPPATSAEVTDQGSGKITFHGSIIDAPCSIKGSPDQIVELGSIANVQLEDEGTSTPADFRIELEKCKLKDKYKSVTVTFKGSNGEVPDSFSISGVTGASLIINDGKNQKLKPGSPTDAQTLANGNNTLAFSAYVQGNPGATSVKLGEFNSIVDFTLAYQ